MGRRIAIMLGLAAIIVITATFGARSSGPSVIRLGAPSDAAGLLAVVAAEEAGTGVLTRVGGLETFPVNDCCATVSQWAMSSDSVDMALMCPDAASALLARDDRFQILGPCLYNAEVLVARPNVRVLRVGTAQRRQRHEDLARRHLGAGVEMTSMLPASLPYAYEKRVVDAVVVDFFTALSMKGETLPLAEDGEGNISYVLVTRKTFLERPEYPLILEAFRAAVDKLSDPAELRLAAMRHKRITLGDEEVELWRKTRIRFVSPTNTPTGSPRS